jgi:hypothetical protein
LLILLALLVELQLFGRIVELPQHTAPVEVVVVQVLQLLSPARAQMLQAMVEAVVVGITLAA